MSRSIILAVGLLLILLKCPNAAELCFAWESVKSPYEPHANVDGYYLFVTDKNRGLINRIVIEQKTHGCYNTTDDMKHDLIFSVASWVKISDHIVQGDQSRPLEIGYPYTSIFSTGINVKLKALTTKNFAEKFGKYFDGQDLINLINEKSGQSRDKGNEQLAY